MTKPNVILLSHTVEPETTAALGGRLCYSDSDIASLHDAVAPRAAEFVDKLTGFGHLSPIEHASFTFGVEGVSRALLAQLTRHRIASFSVQSQRYVNQSGFDYVTPPSVTALGEAAQAEYERQMQMLQAFYDEWIERGLKPEDARFVLPNAAATRIIMTMNARELMHFFSLRCCERAQWEIRRMAWCMLGIARRVSPALFCGSGPDCISRGCHEGNMSCKNAARMKALSDELNEISAAGASDTEIMDWVLNNIGGSN